MDSKCISADSLPLAGGQGELRSKRGCPGAAGGGIFQKQSDFHGGIPDQHRSDCSFLTKNSAVRDDSYFLVFYKTSHQPPRDLARHKLPIPSKLEAAELTKGLSAISISTAGIVNRIHRETT